VIAASAPSTSPDCSAVGRQGPQYPVQTGPVRHRVDLGQLAPHRGGLLGSPQRTGQVTDIGAPVRQGVQRPRMVVAVPGIGAGQPPIQLLGLDGGGQPPGPVTGLRTRAAQGKNLQVLSPSIGRQLIQLGLVDEIDIHIAPVLLGDGIRVYDAPGGHIVRWQRDGAEPTLAAHVRYRPIPADQR
jgi:hypothetical protein